VTLLDGLVLARSAFDHSVNFRSVMVFGRAEVIKDSKARARHLQAMFDQMFPGRWPQLRPMTDKEVRATAVLSLPITEASAKIGDAMPDEPPEDLAWPVWAGMIPLRRVADAPKPDGPPKGPTPTFRRFVEDQPEQLCSAIEPNAL
jgi:hypothetical protein